MEKSREFSPSEMMLFSPIDVGPVKLENRIAFAPTDLEMTPGGFVSDLFKRFNLRRARAGLGLIILGGVAVTPSKSGDVCRINSDEYVPGLKELADLIHSETKTKLFVQLTHFLKLSRSGYRQKVEDLTYDDFKVIKSQFVAGALRAKQAGFDGVELHYAHAYTMASLLSRLSNKRTDMYGRTLEGRLRFPIEVLRAVREAVGKDFVVGARINGDEFISGGNTLLDSIPIAIRLAEEGLDYLSISCGGKFEDATVFHGRTETQPGVPDPYSGYSGQRSFPWYWMPNSVNVYLAEAIRKALREAGYNIPVMTAGKIPTPDIAEDILRSEKADLIGLCRPLVCDPEWPLKARLGRWNEIITCEYGNHCYRKWTGPRIGPIRCIKWPKDSDDQAPYEVKG